MNRDDLTPGVRYHFGYRRLINRPQSVHEFDATVRGFDGDNVLVEMSDRAATGRSGEALHLNRIAFANPTHLPSVAGGTGDESETASEWRARLAGYREETDRA